MPELAAIELTNASKTFPGGLRALIDANLEVRAGEVHGLVGQNGSGKSTLIKILSGFHSPDSGAHLKVRGRDVDLPLRPGEFRHLGLSFVHQDLGLVDTLTVLDNVRVGRYPVGRFAPMNWRKERSRLRAALARFGLGVGPDTLINSMNDIDRALLAILRATAELEGVEGGLLVLDEPTVYLPRDGVERLFTIVRDIAASGSGVLLVTHQLGEIRAVTQRVTVLRDGRVVETADTASMTEDELIGKILGRSLEDLYPDFEPRPQRETALEAVDLDGGGVHGVTLRVHPGEVVGVTGLAGMGFEEVPYLLTGARRSRSGTVKFGERSFNATSVTPGRALRERAVLVPGNRARDGVVGGLTVEDNISLPVLDQHFRAGVLRHRESRKRVNELLRQYDVRPPDPKRPIITLSGGNQQKAVLAKWLQIEPRVLLMHEPTQGVDVGARKQIFEQVRSAAESGAAVLVASTEYEDLAHICDRVLVFRDGRITSELDGADLTEERIVERSYRTVTAAAAAAGSDGASNAVGNGNGNRGGPPRDTAVEADPT